MTLTWPAVPGAVRFTLYRGSTSGGETVDKTGLTGTSFTDTGLSNGTAYYYQVTAVNAGGESGRSNEAAATPQAGATAPGTPWLTQAMGGNGLNYYYQVTAVNPTRESGRSREGGATPNVAPGVTGPIGPRPAGGSTRFQRL